MQIIKRPNLYSSFVNQISIPQLDFPKFQTKVRFYSILFINKVRARMQPMTSEWDYTDTADQLLNFKKQFFLLSNKIRFPIAYKQKVMKIHFSLSRWKYIRKQFFQSCKPISIKVTLGSPTKLGRGPFPNNFEMFSARILNIIKIINSSISHTKLEIICLQNEDIGSFSLNEKIFEILVSNQRIFDFPKICGIYDYCEIDNLRVAFLHEVEIRLP